MTRKSLPKPVEPANHNELFTMMIGLAKRGFIPSLEFMDPRFADFINEYNRILDMFKNEGWVIVKNDFGYTCVMPINLNEVIARRLRDTENRVRIAIRDAEIIHEKRMETIREMISKEDTEFHSKLDALASECSQAIDYAHRIFPNAQET